MHSERIGGGQLQSAQIVLERITYLEGIRYIHQVFGLFLSFFRTFVQESFEHLEHLLAVQGMLDRSEPLAHEVLTASSLLVIAQSAPAPLFPWRTCHQTATPSISSSS
jgi:hypothetical protein